MLDYNAFLPALKRRYPADRVEELMYKNSPFFAMVAKDPNFYGSTTQIPLVYARPQNRSASFSVANNGTGSSKLKDFQLSRVKDYSLGTVDNETLEASKNSEGAFLDALALETRGVINSLGQSISRKIFGSGSGKLGKVSSYSAGVITLTEPNDVVNFEVGMVLVGSTANGGGSLIAGEVEITAVDRVNGTVTVSGSWTPTADDYIFAKGDYDAALSGLDAWLPYDDRSTRLAATFFNVVRTADTTRLGGWIKDYSSQPIEEALIDGAALLGREGGMPDYCFMNTIDFANLEKALGAKVQYTTVTAGSMGHISFAGIKLNGPTGIITVMPDKNCPKGRFFMVQMNTWKLHSIGEPVRIFDGDGLKLLRSPTQDGVDIRAYFYGNLACQAPGYNMQAAI